MAFHETSGSAHRWKGNLSVNMVEKRGEVNACAGDKTDRCFAYVSHRAGRNKRP